ncbi:uncharacterized protein LOC126163201 [Schistocerca cancellata]|uniref:uncharacterized protein LOC126163201 n=1 Tax=Schistocerca cancellata TaxID=274614 RepID=UPI0021199970|nr:uncharacterized protein LOC126163201 [Schistocerca cancellata]
MTCRLKLKKLQKGGNLRRWDLDKLKEPEVVQSFSESIREQLTGMGERNTVEEEWVALRDEVVKAAEDQVGKKTRASRNLWVTEEILNLIDERRKYKNAVNEAGKKEYKRLKNEIDRKCKMAKQGWLEDKCKDVEAYLTRGKIDTAYRKIKETFGDKRNTCINFKSSDGNPVLSKEGKAERWKEYIEGLHKGDVLEDNIMEMEEDVDEDEMGDAILHEEFHRALKDLRRNKAPGVDNIPLELLTALGKPVLTKLYHLVSKMYETGEIPSDVKKNIIIPIPKEAGVDRCVNYCTISLISHGCKILTQIHYRQMEKLVETDLGEDQFGFRRNTGTREAILTLQLILEERLRKGKPMFLPFVDLEKAFDNVDWNTLFQTLKVTGVKYRERKAIYNLDRNQMAVIRVEGHEREAVVGKGQDAKRKFERLHPTNIVSNFVIVMTQSTPHTMKKSCTTLPGPGHIPGPALQLGKGTSAPSSPTPIAPVLPTPSKQPEMPSHPLMSGMRTPVKVPPSQDKDQQPQAAG